MRTSFNDISSKWKLITAILVCEIGGIASGFFSQSGLGVWFMSLNKPTWNPPSYLFAPVWTTLYLLMGISFWLIWKSNAPNPTKKNAMIIFGIQLFFNFWWSILFFKFHSPLVALIDIVLMFITINMTIFSFAKISRTAAWLLVPYISWVSFASLLNFTIWMMNR